MSFVDRSSVMTLVEELLHFSWPTEKGPINVPFKRMTYEEAMKDYGVDKPDTRFNVKVKIIRTFAYLALGWITFISWSVCLSPFVSS